MPALPPFRQLSVVARGYVIATVGASVAMTLLALVFRPISGDEIIHVSGIKMSLPAWPTLLYLAVGTQIAALLPIRWKNGVQYVFDPLLIATGLFAPGGGVGLVAWFATFDGRVPSRQTPLWVLVFNRAMYGISHVVPSLAVSMVAREEWWGLPLQTALYVIASVAINYVVAARALSFAKQASFWDTLEQNVGGVSTLVSTAILAFSGGILFLLVLTPLGKLMAPALFGFILAVRGNVADAQRQTELKDQTLELAAQALDARDRYTESHSIRVAELAGRLGERLDMGDRECELLRTAGSLHDLGKIGVRDDILNKPGPLTTEEWEIMRRHPDIGADMIVQHSALAEVAPLVRHHHERWDGSGYPAGLKGERIPFGARILSVADSFDTITGARLYRRSLMTPIEAVEDISNRAGRWYDPDVVDALRGIHGLGPVDFSERMPTPRRVTTIRVLRSSPGFTRLLAAIGVSGLGDPLTQVAALVSVYAATGSDPRAVSLAFIAQALGTIVMSGALGGLVDRFPRRRLLVSLEATRAVLLFATPLLAMVSVWLIVPVLFLLAAVNAVVQPARQAALPTLVSSGQIGKANAITTATIFASGAIGYALAGVVILAARELHFQYPTTILFVADGLSFAVAGLLVLSISNLGGGSARMQVTGAMRRAWHVDLARPHLVIAVLAGFLLAMSFPALVALSFKLTPTAGAQTYSVLEVVVSIGIIVGSLLVGRSRAIGTMGTAGAGLLLTGLFSLGIILTSMPFVVGMALFLASVGNPIYTVANQTALLEAGDPSNRGSIMASRFSLVQAAGIAGAALGGVLTKLSGPLMAYGVLAIGLILLGMFAVAAGRRTVNRLHGRQYEEVAVLDTDPHATAVEGSNGHHQSDSAQSPPELETTVEAISNRA